MLLTTQPAGIFFKIEFFLNEEISHPIQVQPARRNKIHLERSDCEAPNCQHFGSPKMTNDFFSSEIFAIKFQQGKLIRKITTKKTFFVNFTLVIYSQTYRRRVCHCRVDERDENENNKKFEKEEKLT
jgi:hypothetical protein